jgi:hypothetical protein
MQIHHPKKFFSVASVLLCASVSGDHPNSDHAHHLKEGQPLIVNGRP